MSQEYEPVTWQDETTGQQGTLINAERLDQMQTAHHYADGWEEVDAVPSGDPGVDYHKVVYCTADSTFYRWNGSAWTKDIDDVTKAELDAEIERATLAEEALDSAKADKATTLAGYGITDAYTKAQTDTLLAGKMDDGDAYTKAEADALLADKVGIEALSDGSVTKVGTADVGGDLYPIKLVAGVPTAVANALVDTATAQTIGGVKTFTSALTITGADLTVAEDSGTGGGITAKTVDTSGNVTIGGTLAVTGAITGSLTGPATKLGTVDVGTDTKPIKLVAGVPTPVTYDLVDVYNAQSIAGVKTFTAAPIVLATNDLSHIDLKSTRTTGNIAAVLFKNGNDATVGSLAVKGTGEIGITSSITGAYVTIPNRAYNATNTTDAVNIALLDAYSPMVRTTNEQDIAGEKAFLANMFLKKSNLDVTVAPNNSQYWGLIFADKNKKEFGGLRCAYTTARDNYLYFALRNLDTDQQVATFTFYKDRMTGPYRAYNASNTSDIATIGTLDQYSPMVRTSGNQTIGGNKSFTAQMNIAAAVGKISQHGRVTSTSKYELCRFGVTEAVNCTVFVAGMARGVGVMGALDIAYDGVSSISLAFRGTTLYGSSGMTGFYAYLDNGQIVICYGNESTGNNYLGITVIGAYAGAGNELTLDYTYNGTARTSSIDSNTPKYLWGA